MEENKLILEDVSTYYSSKVAEHGVTPQGVDWNGKQGQICRFVQLCKIIEIPGNFSLNDLGCGYGALLEYLNPIYENFIYYGYDISESMIGLATETYKREKNAGFIINSEPSELADYTVASGIFNVRLEYSDHEWWDYMTGTIDSLNKSSRIGFSFNCLTSYSDKEKMRSDLYYADPCKLFDYCKTHYSNQVALLHDYGLYEFTILVRKNR